MRKLSKIYDEKLKETLRIPFDKFMHVCAGFTIFLVASLFFSTELAMVAVVAIGALKELLWDGFLHKGTVELMDWVATVAGGVLAAVIVLIFNIIFN